MQIIMDRERLRCYICKNWYDQKCSGVGDKRYRLMMKEDKDAWKCPCCISKCPKVDNTETPVRPEQRPYDQSRPIRRESPPDANVNKRRRQPATSPKSPAQRDSDIVTRENLREIISQEIHGALKMVVEEKFQKIHDSITEFHKSLNFFNEQYEEVRVIVESNATELLKIKKENADLKATVCDLSERLSLMEQHSRESNIEISCLPEHRSENLKTTIIQMAQVVSSSIKEDDIQMIKRVAKLNPSSPAPRSVIVKLRNSMQRDELLASVSKFNKTNSTDKLNTSHLGIAGNKSSIFVSEHLSPSAKKLHAAVRKAARQNGFKFVWVRNGRIFVRKHENADSNLIRNFDVMDKIFEI